MNISIKTYCVVDSNMNVLLSVFIFLDILAAFYRVAFWYQMHPDSATSPAQTYLPTKLM